MVDCQKLGKQYHEYGETLKNYITDIEPLIFNSIKHNEKIVVEGAQAFRLDLDHGDYPMVTSKHITVELVMVHSLLNFLLHLMKMEMS